MIKHFYSSRTLFLNWNFFLGGERLSVDTGFPKKDARFSELKNIHDLLRGDKGGK